MRSHDGPTLFAIVPLARQLRRRPTPPEALLWRRVCGKQLGVRVRRQHPLYPFVVDFYVASYRLVVEIDGAIHAELEARDRFRDAELARIYGVRVLRIPARLVLRDVEAAVALIRAAMR